MKYRALVLSLLLLIGTMMPLVAFANHPTPQPYYVGLYINPTQTNITGPICTFPKTFDIDVNLWNNKSATGYAVYAYDFYVYWTPETWLTLTGFTNHIPWTSGNYFLVVNASSDAGGWFHESVTMVGLNNASELGWTGTFDASLVTLHFSITDEPCWPFIWSDTFAFTGVKLSGDGSAPQQIPDSAIELDIGTLNVISSQPNIDPDAAKSESAYPASINESAVGNTHTVEIHLTNVTKAYGFSFTLTWDKNYWDTDIQKVTICPSFAPPYTELTMVMSNESTPAYFTMTLTKPCEKPTVCGADMCIAKIDFVSDAAPILGPPPIVPVPASGVFAITAAYIVTKCPINQVYFLGTDTSRTTGATTLLYSGDLPWYFTPKNRYDLDLNGKVNMADLSDLAAEYGQITAVGGWGDLSAIGTPQLVDIYDFVAVAKHFGDP